MAQAKLLEKQYICMSRMADTSFSDTVSKTDGLKQELAQPGERRGRQLAESESGTSHVGSYALNDPGVLQVLNLTRAQLEQIAQYRCRAASQRWRCLFKLCGRPGKLDRLSDDPNIPLDIRFELDNEVSRLYMAIFKGCTD